MVNYLSVFSVAILVGAVFAAPSPSLTKGKDSKDVHTKAHGPMDGWTPIRLIDVFPNATVDGEPADESVIYSYVPPANITSEALRNLIAGRSISAKRQSGPDSTRCSWGGHEVAHNQIISASGTFCGEAVAALPYGGQHTQNKNLWLDGSTWRHFTNQYGGENTVFFGLTRMGNRRTPREECVARFTSLSHQCPAGVRSVGGEYKSYLDGYLIVQFETWD